jgi:hypothetical protein
VLVGNGLVLVQGHERTGIWDLRGQPLGVARSASDNQWLDVSAGRLLGEDVEGGLSVYMLQAAAATEPGAQPLSVGGREGSLVFGAPSTYAVIEIMAGPCVCVFITANESPFAGPREYVVEAIRISDYANRRNGMLYGVEPLGGMRRTEGGKLRAAAARTGPVLATPEGVLWCDWQLNDLAFQRIAGTPVALSVDPWDRAHLVAKTESGLTHRIVGRDGVVGSGLTLDWRAEHGATPAIIDPQGYAYLTPPGRVLAIGPNGDALWHQVRDGKAPATMTANGALLLLDEWLYAVSSTGERWQLWYPHEPIVTSVVLCGGLLYACSNETLFVLGPQP